MAQGSPPAAWVSPTPLVGETCHRHGNAAWRAPTPARHGAPPGGPRPRQLGAARSRWSLTAGPEAPSAVRAQAFPSYAQAFPLRVMCAQAFLAQAGRPADERPRRGASHGTFADSTGELCDHESHPHESLPQDVLQLALGLIRLNSDGSTGDGADGRTCPRTAPTTPSPSRSSHRLWSSGSATTSRTPGSRRPSLSPGTASSWTSSASVRLPGVRLRGESRQPSPRLTTTFPRTPSSTASCPNAPEILKA